MDPNAALTELRALIQAREGYAHGENEFWQHDEDRLLELSTELVGWLDRGGCLPKDWTRK